MAVGDVYIATLTQKNGQTGERANNMFAYLALDEGCTAVKLAGEFESGTNLVDKINDLQTGICQNVGVRVINLFDLTDFTDEPVSGTGANGGDGLPMHSALNFTLKVGTRAVRPGSKRVSFIPESAQVHGLVNDGDYIGLIDILRAQLAATITDTDADEYQPIVVKRILRPADATHDAPYYTLPYTLAELVYGAVTAAVVNLRVSHQVSRGNGR